MLGLGATGERQAIEADRAVAEAELERLFELRFPPRAEIDAPMDRERRRVTALVGGDLTQPGDARCQIDRIQAGDQQGHPPVGRSNDSAQHRVGRATPDQDRDLVNGQRVDPDAAEVVEATLEVDDRPGPELAQHVDLLLEDRRPVGEVDAEPVVLGRVPPDADGHPEAATAQQVDRRDLLGHQRRLALRQHEHARDELQRRREGCEMAVQDQDLVERVLRRVRRGRERTERARPESLGRCTQDVVVGQHVLEAGRLDVDDPPTYRFGVGAGVGL